MSIDVSVLSKIKPNEIQVLVNDPVDLNSIAVLYDNCIRMGNWENSNVKLATIHPELWFGDYINHLYKFKLIVKSPTFQTLEKVGDEIHQYSTTTYDRDIESDSLEEFFNSLDPYKTVALFAIIKYLDVISLKTSWKIKYVDISKKSTVRDLKIDSII